MGSFTTCSHHKRGPDGKQLVDMRWLWTVPLCGAICSVEGDKDLPYLLRRKGTVTRLVTVGPALNDEDVLRFLSAVHSSQLISPVTTMSDSLRPLVFAELMRIPGF
jgi:hypothetical protein